MSDEPLHEVRFTNHQPPPAQEPPPGYERMGGAFVTPAFQRFVQAAMEGTLPPPPPADEVDPQIVALAQELSVLHLPEWVAPNGRKIAEPSVMQIKQTIRIAQYLIRRGVSFDPDNATIRWVPTPGVRLGLSDLGKHLERNPDGTWPETPDAEEFWNVDDIDTQQLPDGRWAAVHPRGISCEAATKTEAFADCVESVRAKIAELREDS